MKPVTIYPLILCSFYYVTPCLSQENFIPGYVVTQNLDTAQVVIDFRQWSQSPEEIRYMLPDGTVQKAAVPDLAAFGVHDNKYIEDYLAYQGKVVDLPGRNASLKQTREIEYRDETTFLRCLANGNITLYYYMDYKGNHHFFVKNLDGPLTELIYNEYYEVKYTTPVRVREEMYKRQLGSMMYNCKSAMDKLPLLQYNEKSMVKLIKQYNDCTVLP